MALSRPRAALAAGLAAALCCSVPALSQDAAPELIDRVVAVVDEDPILASEVGQVAALGMVQPLAGESDRSLRRRILDQLIEQRLRFHEIDSFGFVELPTAEVEKAFAEIRDRFASDSAFEQRLNELGLEADSLRRLVARQLMVLTYVDERLGPRVFVDLEDIRAYYDGTFAPEMRQRGAAVPALPAVREAIRALLKEERLNEEIERWTEELRRAADVEDYFDDVEGPLPGVVAAAGEGATGS
ncbi:MAG: hypothetical protein OES32_03220 [Acidobacteriota bacterium]|nr:hypothetical protein [Acidobacteriota bacterium]MDH3522573.1 hypothetical protein [Acidobacteriota bacterium]